MTLPPRDVCLRNARIFVRMAREEIERPRTISDQTAEAVRERTWLRVLEYLVLAEQWHERARGKP